MHEAHFYRRKDSEQLAFSKDAMSPVRVPDVSLLYVYLLTFLTYLLLTAATYILLLPVEGAKKLPNEVAKPLRNYGKPFFPVFLMPGHDCTVKMVRSIGST